MIHKTSDIPVRYSYNMRLPKDAYTARCVEEKFDISKNSGNPMLIREWEVTGPEVVQIDGNAVIVAGAVKVRQYKVLRNIADPSKNKALISSLKEDWAKLGLPMPAEIDDENPPLLMKGALAEVVLDSEERTKMAPLTEEQKLRGDTTQVPELDASGNEVKTFQPRLAYIKGPAVEAQAPY